MNMQGIFISFEDGQPGGLFVAVSSGSVANAAGHTVRWTVCSSKQ